MYSRRFGALGFLGLLLWGEVGAAEAPKDSVGTLLGRVVAGSPAEPVPPPPDFAR